MFNLEQSIADWRKQMLAAGIKTPVPLEELEIHLRDAIAGFRQRGLNDEESFRLACAGTGPLPVIAGEFHKIGVTCWNKPMALTAWTMFVASLFLPLYDGLQGYVCAMDILPVQQFVGLIANGKLEFITMELLNYTTFLMIASPVLLFWLGTNSRLMKWLNRMIFAAVILVGWFMFYEFIRFYGKVDIMPFGPGCYVWATSFALLFFSTIQRHSTKEQYV